MKIFLDTEFSSFVAPELISIGMAAEDDRNFYGERNDFILTDCSDFVKETVLPKLGQMPECVYNKSQLAKAVREWLNQFKKSAPVLCFDYTRDLDLLIELLDDGIPNWIQTRNVSAAIDELQFEHFMTELFNGAQHHALHDAICNKLAFRPDK